MDDARLMIWNNQLAVGKRSYNNSRHWEELPADYSLLGKPKKVLVLSGSGADNSLAANGMCKTVEKILGPVKDNCEICGFYYPNSDRTAASAALCAEEVFSRFFVPLIAKSDNSGNLQRLSREEACENMRNVVLFTHCYGSYISHETDRRIDELMAEIGYSETEIKDIHRQLIVAHHNDPSDNLGNSEEKSCNIYRITHSDERNKPSEYQTDTFPQYIIREQFTDDDVIMAEISDTEHALIVGRLSEGAESEHSGGYWVDKSKKTLGARKEEEIFCEILREAIRGDYYIENLRQVEDKALQNRPDLRENMDLIREYGKEFLDDFHEQRQSMRLSFGRVKQKLLEGRLLESDITDLNEDVLFLTDKNKQNLLDYAVKADNPAYASIIWRAMSAHLDFLGEHTELSSHYARKPANVQDACMRYLGYLQKALDENNVEMFSALVEERSVRLLDYGRAGIDTGRLVIKMFEKNKANEKTSGNNQTVSKNFAKRGYGYL